MNKFNRTLALLLVVVMTLGAVPMSSAMESPDSVETTVSNSTELATVEEPNIAEEIIQSDGESVPEVSIDIAEGNTSEELKPLPSSPTDGLEDSTESIPTDESIPATSSPNTDETIPSETTIPEESTPVEESKPIEESKPAETVSPTEGTIPTEEIIPTEESKPVEDTTSTVPTDPSEESKPSETTAPTEPEDPNAPREIIPIKIGDSLFVSRDGLNEYETEDDRLLGARRTISVTNMKEKDCGEIYFTNYYFIGSGKDVDVNFTGNMVRVLSFFTLSDGSTAYCLEPYYAGPNGGVYEIPFDWGPVKCEGVARALAYGAPNNGDTSDAGKYATAAIIWDIMNGYRYKDGTYSTYAGSTFTSTPFEKAVRQFPDIKSKYDMILYRMGKHGLIPSFTVNNKANIGAANTVTLRRNSNGMYTGSVEDKNQIVSAFQFNSPISGLTITRSGSTLNFSATAAAAEQLKSGVVISSRRSSAPISAKDPVAWKKDGTNPSGRKYQEIVCLPGAIDPVPCFFKVNAVIESGKATLKKTSDGSPAGYCFKLFRWGSGQSWYGKTDANGNMYQTDSNYSKKTGGYEFTGLEDGDYTVKEALSYHGAGNVVPTSWRFTVTNKAGKVTYDRTFKKDEIMLEPNGDAKLKESKIHLTGLSGGGKLTMTVRNESNEYPFTLKKTIDGNSTIINQLKGNKCYSLEGAKYEVRLNGVLQETLTTDANGIANSSKKYKKGTKLTIKETVAPKGFALDPDPHDLYIQEGTNVINVKDKPSFDPRSLRFLKIDKKTGKPVAQGDANFTGTVFKWEYFDNYNWSGKPLKTWYFKTDNLGIHYYEDSYLATDSPNKDLYVNEKGSFSLPLGSLKVTELNPPTGYNAIQPLYGTIKLQPDGKAKFDWTPESWNVVIGKDNQFSLPEPEDQSTFGSISIQKKDKDFGVNVPAGATFAGCEFTVYNKSANAVTINDKLVNPGEPCCVLTADAKGQVSTGNIFPIGTYMVKETKGNEYYECNTSWSQTFKVTKGSVANPKYFVDCVNTLKPAQISIEKVNPTGTHLAGAKFALEYSQDNQTWRGVSKSSVLTVGGCTSPNLTSDGCLITDDSGKITFTGLYPTLFYRVVEVEAPEGYSLLKDPVDIGKLTPESNFTGSIKVVNTVVFSLPVTGAKELVLFSTLATICAMTSVVAFVYYKKKKKEV